MIENNQVNFQVGEFSVTLEIRGAEVVAASAEGPDKAPYNVDFVFERTVPIEAGGCMICRRVGGQYVCQEIECSSLVVAPSYSKGA
jgi:hypothetical protein